MPRTARLAPMLAATAALAGPWAAAPADAGEYTVRQCDYATGNGHHDFVWQQAGQPTVDVYAGSGCGEFGLAVRNSGGGSPRSYPSGAYGGWFAYAPPGTLLTGFSGAFGVLEGCCVSGMAAYAEATERHDGQGARAYLFQGSLGNQTWGAPSGVAGPVGRGWSAATTGFAARRVGFHLRCGPGFTCQQGPYGDLRLRGRSFDFTVRDDAPPGLGEPGGSLLAGGWLRGVRTLTASAGDAGGGLTGLDAAFDTGLRLESPSGCTVVAGRYARLQPCPLGRGAEWAVDTARLPDGARSVELRAADAGGAVARATRAFAVDNHAPASPREPVVAGGEHWRAANGFALRWENPGGQHAPIVRARWRACRAGAAETDAGACVAGERAAAGVAASGPIALPAAGEWSVRAWLEDAAGNADAASASPPRRLRFDPDPPLLAFAPLDPADPARVSVHGADLSGIAGGTVELRPYGFERWTAVPTERHGDRLTAVLDDRRLADGVYDLRARAVDAAGNEAIAYGGGRTLPLRAATRLRATVEARVVRRRRGCRPARAAACRVAHTVRGERVRVALGAVATVRGTLATAGGVPLAGAPLSVATDLRPQYGRKSVGEPAGGAPRATIGTGGPPAGVRTDAEGRFAFRLRAGRSAAVALAFDGDRLRQPSGARVAIEVPAKVTIAASGRAVRAVRRRVGGRTSAPGRRGHGRTSAPGRRGHGRTSAPQGSGTGAIAALPGRRLVFHGRLRGGSIPERGKLVEVQAHFRGRWRTISAVRSRRDGGWRFPYRFGATGRRTAYRMRARVPAEAGYPFAAGASPTLRVTVLAR